MQVIGNLFYQYKGKIKFFSLCIFILHSVTNHSKTGLLYVLIVMKFINFLVIKKFCIVKIFQNSFNFNKNLI
jgi:hypothetical protein